VLVNIQFLRFAAAMLVVLFHEAAHLRATGHEAGWLFGFGARAGFAGVDLFFVISGFIMAWTTQNETGPADAWRFARRRVARIYSGYWPFCLLALLVFAVTDPARLTRIDLPGSLVLWPISMPKMLIPVAWTLVFEMIFYTAFTLAIAVGGRRRAGLIGVAFVVVLALALYNQFIVQAWSPENIGRRSLAAAYGFSPYLVEFLAGAVLAYVLRRPGGSALFGWGLLAVGAAAYSAGGWINAEVFDGRIGQGYFVFWRVAVFGTAGVLIVAGLVRLDQAGISAPARFSLATGGASYAIYLSHTLVLEATRGAGLNAWLGGRPAWLAQATFIALAVAILWTCVTYYQRLERPLHKLFRRALRV